VTGKERFANIHGSEIKCEFIEPGSIPMDTNVVILNAFSISFTSTITDVFRDNVHPILQLLEQCAALPDLKKIIFVSTAYVTPPDPYPVRAYLLRQAVQCTSIIDHCDEILNGELTWEEIRRKSINPHFVHNTYIYSKIVTEIACTYLCDKMNCSLSIIRPSQIMMSTDGKRGSRFGSMAFLLSLKTLFIRSIISRSSQDVIPVDTVADAVLNECTNEKNRIVFATSGNQIESKVWARKVYPEKKVFFFKEKTILFKITRWTELTLCDVIEWFGWMSSRQNRAVHNFYKFYEYFNYNHWYFPENYPFQNIEDYWIKMRTWIDSN